MEEQLMDQRYAALDAASGQTDSAPLPEWLKTAYYIFPIVLYVPDIIFNFWVYTDGTGVDFNHFELGMVPQIILWFFLSAGIVGMAWLFSVLAPWHWNKRNHFQSFMCWLGLAIAMSFTTWNSLAYRSVKFSEFKTDEWLNAALGIHMSGFSPTMVLVAVSPPFWGLFWAIVQPHEGKRSAFMERQQHEQKLEKLRLDAEFKRARAQENSKTRSAQLSGFMSNLHSAKENLRRGAAMNTMQEDIGIAPPMIIHDVRNPSVSEKISPRLEELRQRSHSSYVEEMVD